MLNSIANDNISVTKNMHHYCALVNTGHESE